MIYKGRQADEQFGLTECNPIKPHLDELKASGAIWHWALDGSILHVWNGTSNNYATLLDLIGRLGCGYHLGAKRMQIGP